MQKFFMAIIGSGPAGYVAAIHAAQKNVSVALIEAKDLGGTCLNHGCIPTKYLLSRAHLYQNILQAKQFQIFSSPPTFDYPSMIDRKNTEISQLRKSLENLLISHGVNIIFGQASFVDAHTLNITQEDKKFSIEAEKILIATGSKPQELSYCPIDEQTIYSSEGLLSEKNLPEKLLIIGGGYIGCECADLFSSFGTSVILCECAPKLLPHADSFLGNEAKKILEKKGVEIHTNAKVTHVEKDVNGVRITLENSKIITAPKVLIAIGRKPLYDHLNLAILPSLSYTPKNFIKTEETMQTSIDHIYAIGDVTGKSMLAHGASFEAHVAIEHIFARGAFAPQKTKKIPSAIFLDPEIASVGITEEEALEKKIDIITAIYPLKALGKYIITHEMGFAKLIADKASHIILGAHLVAPGASDLISELTLAIESSMKLEDFSHIIHPHPSDSELWHEAALLALGTPLHFPPVRKKT